MNIPDIQFLIDECNFCIEIGGPTPEGYEFIETLGLKLPANIVITNTSNPVTLNPFGESPTKHNVNEVVDINHLPYQTGSIDMILTSSFPRKLRHVLIDASTTVLREGGLLIMQNRLDEDEKYAIQRGFKPLLTKELAQRYYSQIFQYQ